MLLHILLHTTSISKSEQVKKLSTAALGAQGTGKNALCPASRVHLGFQKFITVSILFKFEPGHAFQLPQPKWVYYWFLGFDSMLESCSRRKAQERRFSALRLEHFSTYSGSSYPPDNNNALVLYPLRTLISIFPRGIHRHAFHTKSNDIWTRVQDTRHSNHGPVQRTRNHLEVFQ